MLESQMSSRELYFRSMPSLRTEHENSSEEEKKVKEQIVLTNVVKKIRKKRILNIFVSKLMTNLTTRAPQELKVVSEAELNMGRWKGLRIPRFLYDGTIILSLIFLLVMFILASLQAFIPDYQRDEAKRPEIVVLKSISLCIYVVKLFLKSTRISWKSGLHHLYLTSILKSYVKSLLFFIDLIMVGLLAISIAMPDNQAIGVVLFIYCLLMFVIEVGDLNLIESQYLQSDSSQLYWSLFKIVLFNLMFAHFLASLLLAMSFMDQNNNWLTAQGIQSEPWHIIYFFSFYWATTIMMTVGFGDYLPNTPEEAFITAFIQIFSVIILGFNITEIGNIISKIRDMKQELREKLAIYKKMSEGSYQPKNALFYQDKDQVDHLNSQIVNYIIESKKIKRDFKFDQMQDLLEQLPQNLKNAYIQQYHTKIFPDLPFFENLRKQTIQQLAKVIKRRFFYPREELGRDLLKIFILEKGVVGRGYLRKGSRHNGHIIERVQAQNNPTLVNFNFLKLAEEDIQFTLVAGSYSIIWTLEYEDFITSIRKHSIDYEYYFSLVFKHNFTHENWNKAECKRCTSSFIKQSHFAFSCPQLHFNPIKTLIIARQNMEKGIDQRRKPFARKRQRMSKSYTLKLKKNLFSYVQRSIEEVTGKAQELQESPLERAQRIQKYQKHFKEIKENVSHFNKTDLSQIILSTIRYFETGYEDDSTWAIKSDIAHNYVFFFPNQNANRLFLTPLNSSVKKRDYSENVQKQFIVI